MTFTYNASFATDIDRVRFRVQDTVENNGPRPSGLNFADEEIQSLLTDTGNINLTITAMYEGLASEWARYVNTTIGPRREELAKVAGHYLALAESWRDRYGKEAGGRGIVTGYVTRVDGYSEDVTSGDV